MSQCLLTASMYSMSDCVVLLLQFVENVGGERAALTAWPLIDPHDAIFLWVEVAAIGARAKRAARTANADIERALFRYCPKFPSRFRFQIGDAQAYPTWDKMNRRVGRQIGPIH